MKTHQSWSYTAYKPPFIEIGDPYVCRVVPSETTIHLEWLGGDGAYTLFLRERDKGDFLSVGTTREREYTFTGLKADNEYEFFVACGEKTSRVRLARCGKSVGTVVNYLHPDDEAYAFSGRYIGSPALVCHPDGYLLASMDLFLKDYPQNLTIIYRSDDGGKTWHHVSELFPCFWGKLFLHGGALYMLAVSTEYGDLLIGRSDDGGKTFTEPSVLLRGGTGKNNEAGVHKCPQPLVEYNGRIWGTVEWGSWRRGYHAAMVMSAPADSDLLDPASWSFSEPVKYDPTWEGVPKGSSVGNIEGTLCVVDGKFYNLMRYTMRNLERTWGLIIRYAVNTEDPEAPLTYAGVIEFPANESKFMIKYDAQSKRYYTLASRIIDDAHRNARNLLSLMVSEDCTHWEVLRDEIDMRDSDMTVIGFQYVDFEFVGEDIFYLSRTAINGAHSYHDSNYITFHRIENFRKLLQS